MNLKDIIGKDNLSIKDLQQFQRIYDERFVDEKFEGFEKIRHTTLHVAKLLGKLANYCEKREEGEYYSSKQIEEEIIPDLLVYSLWLSKEFDVKPEEAYLKRMVHNIERMYSHKSSEEEIKILKDLSNKIN